VSSGARIPITTPEGAALYRADGTLMYRGDTIAAPGEVLYLLMPVPDGLQVGAVYSLPLSGRPENGGSSPPAHPRTLLWNQTWDGS
jgi:hypothetical protein